MKDTKFIELLNLYLDHQLTPEETALLEAEVRKSPARRALYRQYCQMHKACTQVGARFQKSAPEPRRVTPAAQRPRRSGLALYATGLMAAAACVAIVLVNLPGDGAGVVPAESAPEPTGAAVAAVELPLPTVPLMPALAPRQAELHTVFSTRTLARLAEESAPEAMFVADRERFDWMNQLHLMPLQPEPLLFELAPALTPDTRTFRSQRPYYGTAEMTAFQFQR